jgi:hypothetical protein
MLVDQISDVTIKRFREKEQSSTLVSKKESTASLAITASIAIL